MKPLISFQPPAPVLSVELAQAFGDLLDGHAVPNYERAVADRVRIWLCHWSGETEEHVRNVTQVKVSGWGGPRIGVEITARCAGGDKLLADVRAAGGVMDL